MDISVVLPTFNERGNIVELIDAIEVAVRPLGSVEIVVVDDSSPDGTADLVRQREPKAGGVRVEVFVRTEDRGLAKAIKYGILKCRGAVVVVMDTDWNHDPQLIPQMIELLKHYDLVVGSRFVRGGGMEDETRYTYSYCYNLFVRAVLRTQIQDNLSGFFAMRRTKLMALDLDRILRGYGEYFIRLLYFAVRRDYKVLEVPVFYVLRRHGQSKSRFFGMVRDYSRCVFELRLGK